MPLPKDFEHHLHELLLEVREDCAESETLYKKELVNKAAKTRNAAAMPIAYKDAELHRVETRIRKTIERYLEALSIWAFEITPEVEQEMTQHFALLTSGRASLHFPLSLREDPSCSAVQGTFARERAKLANKLVRQGSNRLRELKTRRSREHEAGNRIIPTSGNTYVIQGTNNIVGSTVDQSAHFDVTSARLQDLVTASRGDARLEELARNINAEPANKRSIAEKMQQWAALANTTVGFAEKVSRLYPLLHAWLQGLGLT